MAAAYKVTTPLVIAKGTDKRDVYLYADSTVPADVPADEVKRLLAGGFISRVKTDTKEKPAGESAEPAEPAESVDAESGK